MDGRRRSEVVGEFLSSRYPAVLGAIVGFGVLLRLGTYVSLMASDPVFFQPSLDSQAFLEWARDIASGDLLGEEVFFLNPLYPYFLAPVVRIFGPMPLLPIRLIQGALGLAVIPLVAGAARRFFGEGIALGAALMAAAWPLLLFYEQYVMIVTLAVFLNALALYLLARLPENPTLLRTFLAGLPLGLAVLARPNVGLFAVLLPIWLLRVGPAGARLKFAVSRTALLALGAVLMVAPCTWRNWYVGEDFVAVTSSGGVNLYVSNNPKSRRLARMTSPELRANPTLIETDAIEHAERVTGREMKPSEISAFFSAKAREEAAAAPWATLGYVGQKFLMFFRGFEIPSSYHFRNQRRETPLLRWIPLSWGVLSPFMLLGLFLVLGRRRWRPGLPAALLYLAYAVGLAIFFPLAHYRAPVLPGALGLGALGVAAVAAPILDLRGSGLLRLAPAGALACVLAFAGTVGPWVGVPVFTGAPDDQVVFYYNRGQMYLGQGKIEKAAAAFRSAMEIDETSTLPHRGLAAVARARREPANERRHLEEALRLNSRDTGALIALARNYFDAGQREDAFIIAEEALRMSPNDGEVLAGLAVMCATVGDHQRAYELFRRAEDSGIDRTLVLIDQCRVLRAARRPAEALANAERALRLVPGNGWLYYEKALALLDLDAPREEIAAAARAGAATGLPAPKRLRPFLGGD